MVNPATVAMLGTARISAAPPKRPGKRAKTALDPTQQIVKLNGK